MSPEERQLLAGLFDRTRNAASAPRDGEAESFINEQVKQQPAAPYLLAQTVLVQDQALQAANQRLQELEGRIRELESQPRPSGGFLSGLLGGGAPRQPPRPAAPPPPPPPGYGQPAYPQQSAGPWGQAPGAAYPAGAYPPAAAAPQGGGFLKGALGTAAGVAGGVLLADSIRGLFHGGGAGGQLGIGSGFAPGAGETTIVNNYYGDSDTGAPDRPYSDTGWGGPEPGAQDASYDSDGGGFDSDDSGGDGGFDA